MARSKKQNVNKAEKASIKTLQEYGVLNIEAKVEEIQQMTPFALMHALETIEENVRRVAGERYSRAPHRLRSVGRPDGIDMHP
jgi:hypothetical protein